MFAHSCNKDPQIEKLIELIDVTVSTLAREIVAADKNNIQNLKTRNGDDFVIAALIREFDFWFKLN